MKRVEVSALRERGLHRACGAEPQADGDTIGRHHLDNRESPINSIERKADTVKTYILRDSDAVEPQIQSLDSRTDPAVAAITAESLAPHLPALSKHRLILFIGLDVHTESIAV